VTAHKWKEDSGPKTSRTGGLQTEDFYLSTLSTQLGASARRFEKVKSQCMDNLLRQTPRTLTTVQGSEHYSGNLLTMQALNSEEDKVPSYGHYAETMPSDVKAFLRESAAMEKIFKSFDNCYYCLEEVITILTQIKDRVKCYKVSLGGLFEQCLTSLKSTVDKILVASLKLVEEHKSTTDRMMDKDKEAVNKVMEEKQFYERRTKELLLYCEVLKEQKEFYQKNLESAKIEVKYMQQREKNIELNKTGGEDVLQRHFGDFFIKREEKLQHLGTFLKELTTEFGSTINSWQEQHAQKKENLMEMEDTLRQMMVGEKTNKECQVNEFELRWGTENVASLDLIQPQFYDNSVKLHGTGINLNKKEGLVKPNDNKEKLELHTNEEGKDIKDKLHQIFATHEEDDKKVDAAY